jgi:hypothetical protein
MFCKQNTPLRALKVFYSLLQMGDQPGIILISPRTVSTPKDLRFDVPLNQVIAGSQHQGIRDK